MNCKARIVTQLQSWARGPLPPIRSRGSKRWIVKLDLRPCGRVESGGSHLQSCGATKTDRRGSHPRPLNAVFKQPPQSSRGAPILTLNAGSGTAVHLFVRKQDVSAIVSTPYQRPPSRQQLMIDFLLNPLHECSLSLTQNAPSQIKV